jgi:cytochrome c biogenesis protein CcmG, thiol:disulfide interchange protein DsbE
VIVVCVVGAALVALLVYGVSAQSTSRTLDDELHSGQHPLAPESTRRLPLLTAGDPASTADPTSETLASYRGKVVVLNFWASWCAPCQEEAPLLEQAQHELQRHDGTILGVTYRDASPDSLKFVHEYHLTYPSLRDTEGEFTHSYGTDELPESFVIDREGRITAISRGEIDKAFLQRAVALAESS